MWQKPEGKGRSWKSTPVRRLWTVGVAGEKERTPSLGCGGQERELFDNVKEEE